MAAPVFSTKSEYLGTAFYRQSDGRISVYGNPVSGSSRISAVRWSISAINGVVSWNLTAGSIVFVSSTSTTYTFDFSPTAEGDYSFTLEATNADGTTSKTHTIGVGRLPDSGHSNDFGDVGPYDEFVFCANSGEQVIGPAFVGNSVNLQSGPNPPAPGIILQLYDASQGAPNFALNINTGPTDLGYGICSAGGYSIPVKGLNTASLTPPGYVLFTITFSLVDCSGGGGTNVTVAITNSITLVDSAAANSPIPTNLLSDALILADGAPSVNLVGISGPPGGGGTGPSGPGGGGSTPPPGSGMGNCIFEFYEMQTPEDVEVLPTPKKYDQLGPMRFDKIGKIFGFRVRMIVNGTTTEMPYKVYGDDSESDPTLSSIYYQGSFQVRPGIDNVYEIQFPKSVNTDICRLTFGPVADSFHRYDVLMKVHTSGMKGQARWMPIK